MSPFAAHFFGTTQWLAGMQSLPAPPSHPVVPQKEHYWLVNELVYSTSTKRFNPSNTCLPFLFWTHPNNTPIYLFGSVLPNNDVPQ